MMNIMLPSFWLNLNSPGRMCTSTLRNGARHFIRFKSNLSEDQLKKEGSLEDRLKRVFERSMRNNQIPLFSEWNSYARSLPRREFNRYDPYLYKLPYWANDKDVSDMADKLYYPRRVGGGNPRNSVMYLAAPSEHGKTASILPAFLKSAEKSQFTHYIYLAFNNNVENYFRVFGKIDEDEEVAKAQGAAFMLECFEILLNIDNKGEMIKICKNPPTLRETKEKFATLFSRFGEANILVHLDEHRKMCTEDSINPPSLTSRNFRRGAFYSIARAKRVNVVATYINRPEIPSSQSSQVCRIPVTLPPIDLDLLAEDVEELKLPNNKRLNPVQRKLLATLRVRLGAKLTKDGLGSLHIKEKMTLKFLQDFKEAASEESVTKALVRCLNLCPLEVDSSQSKNVNAVKLLCGITDTDLSDELERQVAEMVVLGDKVTSSLGHLLTIHDTAFPIYSLGLLRFYNVLTHRQSINYFAQTPLGAAYCWVLSCKSAVEGILRMGKYSWPIKCKDLRPHRLFKGHDVTDYADNFKKMESDTIYYVEEGKGTLAHPLCDIFFCTKKNDLVLINVTGGGKKAVEEKIADLSSWIEREQGKIDVTLHGVVLAPMFYPPVDVSTESISTKCVCGDEARHCLGGLQQILRWLPQDSETQD